MHPAEVSSSTTGSLLRHLVAWLYQDGISILLKLARALRYMLPHRPQGMYENLDYDATLELLDVKGEKAIFHKRQKVKFLQDNIIAFEDYAWGNGTTVAKYKCSPGIVVDRYLEGDRWNVLISLRETQNRGDVVEFHIERKVKDGFLQAEEWHQVEIRRRTHRLQMNVSETMSLVRFWVSYVNPPFWHTFKEQL